MEEYKLILPFTPNNDNDDFVRGWEAAEIYNKAEQRCKFDNYIFHQENKDQILIILDTFGYTYRFDKIDGGWMSLFGEHDLTKLN